MKRKILTMITIGSILCMALTGCGNSSGNRATANKATSSDAATTAVAERPGDAGTEMTKEETEVKIEEGSGAKTETPVVGAAGLYQADGSFIPWDDLGMDVESDYTRHGYFKDAKSPYSVFKDNNYNGNLVLPDNITRIGRYAFGSCESLTSIDVPDTLTSIGHTAFMDCTALTNIDLSNTQIEIIDRETFYDCTSLTSIALPNTLTIIGEQAFGNCESLTSIALPDTLTVIDDKAFGGCESLTSIDLSNTQIQIIEDLAFGDCTSLTSLELPATITSIGEDVFYFSTSLTNIDYAGTTGEWLAISKDNYWAVYSSLETLTCSDGVITSFRKQ